MFGLTSVISSVGITFQRSEEHESHVIIQQTKLNAAALGQTTSQTILGKSDK
jgi:hypothetical protein